MYLVQLNFTCSGEILYQQDYPYESDVTREGREHWKKFADDIVDRFKLNKNDLVIDIGSNVECFYQILKIMVLVSVE